MMMLVNGLRVLFGLGINGLTNIDQDFDPNSENPQSGIAINTHLQNTFAGVRPTDQHFDPSSENPQSGIAINTHLQNTFAGVRPTDQHFDPSSENPQSGIAVAEAMASVGGDGENPWELIEDVTFAETAASYSANFSNRQYKELYIEGVVYAADRTKEKQNLTIGTGYGKAITQLNAAFGHATYDKVLVRAHLFLSPSGTYVCDGTASLFGHAVSGANATVTGRFNESGLTGHSKIPSLYMAVAGQFAEGTTFKVWGR